MNFSFLVGLCLINLIYGRYPLVDVDDQQVGCSWCTPPRSQEPKPLAPVCIPLKGLCDLDYPGRCCEGLTCLTGCNLLVCYGVCVPPDSGPKIGQNVLIGA